MDRWKTKLIKQLSRNLKPFSSFFEISRQYLFLNSNSLYFTEKSCCVPRWVPLIYIYSWSCYYVMLPKSSLPKYLLGYLIETEYWFKNNPWFKTMVFFKYIFFYILKTTRKYGKNLPGMCGKNCFLAQNMTADFRGKNVRLPKFYPTQNFVLYFLGMCCWLGSKTKIKNENVKRQKKLQILSWRLWLAFYCNLSQSE